MHLEALRALGLQAQNWGSSLHLDSNTVIYIAGRYVLKASISTGEVSFMQSSKQVQRIICLAASRDNKYLAISERVPVSIAYGGSQITIYDLSAKPSAKRVRTLIPLADNSEKTGVSDIISMDFSADSKYLVVQYGQPWNKTVVWEWQRSKPISSCEMPAFVNSIKFNPMDSTQISSSGPNHFRMWRIQADVLKPYPPFGGIKTSDTNFMSHEWTYEDRIITATDKGLLMVIDDNDLRQDFYDIFGNKSPIVALAVYENGIVAGGMEGMMCVYTRKAPKDQLHADYPYYLVKKLNLLKQDGSSCSTLRNLSICDSGESVAITMGTNIGIYDLKQLEIKKMEGGSSNAALMNNASISTEKTVINYLLEGGDFHSGAITHISACALKPLIASCCISDMTVKIWNYYTNTLLLTEQFLDIPISTSFHPMGHHVLISFRSRVCLYHVMHNELALAFEINPRGAGRSLFSNGGQWFAVVKGKAVEVFSTYGPNGPMSLGTFSGHTLLITDMCWTHDDLGLITVGGDGAVYEWSMDSLKSGERKHEDVTKGMMVDSVACGIKSGTIIAGYSRLSNIKEKLTMKVGGGNKEKEATKGDESLMGQENLETRRKPATANLAALELDGGTSLLKGWKNHTDGSVNSQKIDARICKLLFLNEYKENGISGAQAIVAGMENGTIWVYDWPILGDNKETSYCYHTNAIRCMATSGNNSYLFTGGDDGVIFVINVIGMGLNTKKQNLIAMEDVATDALEDKDSQLGKTIPSHLITLANRDYINELTDRVSQLLEQVETVTISHENILSLRMEEFKQKFITQEKEFDEKLDNAKALFEAVSKSSADALESFSKSKEYSEEEYMRGVDELQALYEKKLAAEQEKYLRLKDSYNDLQLASKDNLDEATYCATNLQKNLLTSFMEKAMYSKEEYTKLQEYCTYLKSQYEQLMNAQDDQNSHEKLLLKSELVKSKKETDAERSKSRGQATELRRRIGNMQISIDQAVQQSREYQAIAQKEMEAKIKAEKETEIAREGLRIADIERNNAKRESVSYQQDIAELKRYRKILQQQYQEIMSLTVPQDQKIELLKAQISELDTEYFRSSEQSHRLSIELDDKGVKIANLADLLRKSESKVTQLNGIITRFCQDLDKIVAMSDPALWRKEIFNLYQTYVTADINSVKEYKPSDGAVKEFNRQRKLMERGLNEARKTSKRVQSSSVLSNEMRIAENTVLIEQLNSLRSENQTLSRQVEILTSKLNASYLQEKEARWKRERSELKSSKLFER